MLPVAWSIQDGPLSRLWPLKALTLLHQYKDEKGEVDLIPELERSSGEGNGNPLQCSCLGDPTDRGAWRATVEEIQWRRSQESDRTEQLNYHYQRWNSCRRKNHICLVYRDILTWPTWTATNTKDFDAKTLTATNHTPSPF